VLLIGGPTGVGKSTVAIALHELLSGAAVDHAVIEGDYLDLAYPVPHEAFPGFGLAERNLAAQWANYRELGYRRLIFTNTVSVVMADGLAAAMGDDPIVTSVLLVAPPATVAGRLEARALGTSLDGEVARSARMAAWLSETSPASVVRVQTDGRGPTEIAAEIATLLAWSVA
jgi:predicted kinase